ncbi:MAG: alanine/ornithine racemase family PLP-dependent enzyme [Candidatus Hydrogenedentes bacterium]|nr:alanine/ornithine racemase family PLP-dependent enzyme [Candidatus Hydrogenedentota bacterium]
MNQLLINYDALLHNYLAIEGLMRQHRSQWTLVTKVLCGNRQVLKALAAMGMNSVGDSRLSNLKTIQKDVPDVTSWYLRVPSPSAIDQVATLSDVSLNSEITTIQALNDAAGRNQRKHQVVIMIELGDLREGILPGSLINFYKSVFTLPHIEVLGVGANLGCLAGVVPNVDQLMQLVLYRELLELKFNCKLPIISAGTSAALPLLMEGKMPKGINHFRIGEALFLGTNLVQGGTLPSFRNDVFLLDAEIAELKEKSLQPSQETGGIEPFATIQNTGDNQVGQRGYRALVGVGQLDVEISGLTPVNPEYTLAGASSDLTVVNLGDHDDGLKIGDSIQFRLDYAALLRLMNSRYIDKVPLRSVDDFCEEMGACVQLQNGVAAL